MEWTPELMEKLAALRGKIESTGQDFETYVHGWQHAQFKNYWDYIQIETLLSLQRPGRILPRSDAQAHRICSGKTNETRSLYCGKFLHFAPN